MRTLPNNYILSLCTKFHLRRTPADLFLDCFLASGDALSTRLVAAMSVNSRHPCGEVRFAIPLIHSKSESVLKFQRPSRRYGGCKAERSATRRLFVCGCEVSEIACHRGVGGNLRLLFECGSEEQHRAGQRNSGWCRCRSWRGILCW